MLPRHRTISRVACCLPSRYDHRHHRRSNHARHHAHQPSSSSRQVWRKTVAEQLQLRNAVNIHSDMLESPEMYWEEPELEKLFKQMIRNLDVSRRIKIFNERLDYTQEVSEVVQTYSTTRTAHLLEKIIIVLISIEVLFHLMDKSLWWQALTWEDVFGIEPPPPPPPKPPHNNAQ